MSTASRAFRQMPLVWTDGRAALPAKLRRAWPRLPKRWKDTVLDQTNMSSWHCRPMLLMVGKPTEALASAAAGLKVIEKMGSAA